MSPKICAILNYPPHYRKSIYKLMEKELDIDFYFGDKLDREIKKLDYSELERKANEVRNVWIYGPIYYQKGVVALIFKKKYDKYIVTGEFYCLSTWLILLFAKLVGKPVFMWTHGLYEHDKPWKKLVKRFYYNLCEGVFLYNNFTKNMMIDNGSNPEKLHVIYNSLDNKLQRKYREDLQRNSIYKDWFGNNHRVLCYIGRVNADKKLEMLIDAVALLKDRDENYNVVIIGDGEEVNNLKQYANKKGVDNIWFYGACYDESILSNMIFNADLCVSPGDIGLMTIHSLGYGTPVVTHNNFAHQGPEFEAIIDGITGAFFQHNNIISLFETISLWFEANGNSSRDNIATNCYKVVDELYNEEYQIKIIKSAME